MRNCPLLLLLGIVFGAATPTAIPTAQCVSSLTSPAARPFAVYDNTFYTNVDLERYGLIKSNVVYEPSAMRKTIDTGKLPDATAFKSLVRQHDQYPGPVVLDFENLYLRGTPGQANQHVRILTTLAQWAHEAAPGKVIGFYGLLSTTQSQYLRLARQLAPFQDAFFPSLYTFNDDRAAWAQRVRDDLALARSIAPQIPVYLYLWPQYHEGTPRALQYLDSSYWSFQLRTARRYADGVVIWSGRTKNLSPGWVAATATFMRSCQSTT